MSIFLNDTSSMVRHIQLFIQFILIIYKKPNNSQQMNYLTKYCCYVIECSFFIPQLAQYYNSIIVIILTYLNQSKQEESYKMTILQ